MELLFAIFINLLMAGLVFYSIKKERKAIFDLRETQMKLLRNEQFLNNLMEHHDDVVKRKYKSPITGKWIKRDAYYRHLRSNFKVTHNDTV